MSTDSAETVRFHVKYIPTDTKDMHFVFLYLASGLSVTRNMASSWAVAAAALWEGESHTITEAPL